MDELHTLPEVGVFSLALNFKESRRVDEFGNMFRYRAFVNPAPQDDRSKDGHLAYDVLFVTLKVGGRREQLVEEEVNPISTQ